MQGMAVNPKKILTLLLLAIAIGAFFVFDLGRFLSLDYLKSSQAAFADLYASEPLRVAGIYFAIYVAATALSLPGAAIITLAGGAIFGLFWGTVIVSFASSIGATLAFLVSRFVLREHGGRQIWQAAGRDQQGRGKRRRVLPVHAAPDSGGAVFRHQPADGPDQDEGAHLLLGEPARHAGGHAGVRERGHAAGADRVAAGHPQPGSDRFLRAARHLPFDRPKDRGVCEEAQGLRALGQREAPSRSTAT